MAVVATPSSSRDDSSTVSAADAERSSKHCPACGQRYPDDYAVCPRDATPLARSHGGDDPLLGQVLGDTYEITRLLGEGGMGRVYEARHVRLGRRFAVKVLHSHFVRDPESLARFRREAIAAAAVTSPYVAQVVDVHATRDGCPYLVGELLEGEQLGAVLKREGRLDIPRAVAIARQVCKGLAAAHAAGVVHRDLKPENVMLVPLPGGREIAKVLDFGIAKSLVGDGQTSLTRTGVVLGTPAYMAPEQARGSGSIDHRVDVYALGALLYRAVTGRAAFSGDDPTTTLTRVLYEEPERPKALRKDLPDGLELVIQRAMAKSPEARYSSMMELDEALAPFDTGSERTDAVTVLAPVSAPSLPASADIAGAATVAIPRGKGMDSSEGVRARRARPRAVVYGIVALGWCMLLLASLVGASIRMVTGRPLAIVESVLAGVVAAAVTVPLTVGWVRDLARGAWRNTAAMLSRADGLAHTLAASFAAYALVSAGWRAVHELLQRRAGAPHGVDIAALSAGLSVGALVAWRKMKTK